MMSAHRVLATLHQAALILLNKPAMTQYLQENVGWDAFPSHLRSRRGKRTTLVQTMAPPQLDRALPLPLIKPDPLTQYTRETSIHILGRLGPECPEVEGQQCAAREPRNPEIL